MTKKELLDSGYHEFPVPRIGSHTSAGAAYQKRFKDGDGRTLFFVEVYWYDKMTFADGTTCDEAFGAESNLYPKSSKDAWVSVQWHGITKHSVPWLEAQVFGLYNTQLFEIDRHNQ